MKEWAYQLIKSPKKAFRSFRSHNSQIGVALSVWNVGQEDEIAIIEAGISSEGEMARLEVMIQPDIVVLCHIGDAHDIGFPIGNQKLKKSYPLQKTMPTPSACLAIYQN